MLPPSFAAPRAIAALVLACAFGSAACSDDKDRRDVLYGTDVGADYQLPARPNDAAAVETTPAPEVNSEAGTDAGIDSPTPGDAGVDLAPEAAPAAPDVEDSAAAG